MYSLFEDGQRRRSGRLKDEPCREFATWHVNDVEKAIEDQRALSEFNPPLVERIADDRNLRIAWDKLAVNPDKGPGPDGLRFRDVGPSEVWDFIRVAKAAILNGTYRPGPDRKVQIPKASGNGIRTLRLQNIGDRVIARAAEQVLEPIIDIAFAEESCGYRSGRNGSQIALAQAEFLVVNKGRHFVLSDDIADAFDHVPHGRLLDVLRVWRLTADVVGLIERMIANEGRRGLRQGSPLSPLLLNVYLDHFLDRRWHTTHADRPLVRFADDLLLPCESRDEARRLHKELIDGLRSAGMPLKGTPGSRILNLHSGRSLNWLGYQISLQSEKWKVRVAGSGWRRLETKLLELHRHAQASTRAIKVIVGWIGFLGPMFEHENRPAVLQRIKKVASECGFEETPPADWLEHQWEKAAKGWKKVRRSVRRTMSNRAAGDLPLSRPWCTIKSRSAAPSAARDDLAGDSKRELAIAAKIDAKGNRLLSTLSEP